MATDASQILTPFGFTSLESEIYTFLLHESPATGYRIAQALGKAAANTYKSVESLLLKGAVLVEDSSNRQYRAVSSHELLARLTRDFEWRRAEAELMLSRLDASGQDDRIYMLRTRGQALERARAMLGAARKIVVLSCSASIAHDLEDGIASAIRHEVPVLALCPAEIDGIRTAVPTERIGDELRLAMDESESLMASFEPGHDDHAQAVWSKNRFIARCTHRGLSAEFELARLQSQNFTAV